MLEFAQIEAGIYKMNMETADLNEILKSCLDTVKKSAAEKKLITKINFNSNPVHVDVDVHAVENTINNLLSNAVKFTKQGFIEVESGILDERELAFCKIKDSGIGISAEYLDHLFNPFSQEDLNIGRNFEGNGLGLALAKRYVEKLGGSLLVDSIKGVGSTFTLTFPLSKEKARTIRKHKTRHENHLNKICVIDDLQESVSLIAAFLKNKYIIASYNFNTFNTDLLKDRNYEFIIFNVDQNQWDKSLMVCRDIKINDPYKRPIIIISSEFLENRIQQFLDHGADEFIVKPFSRNDLNLALKKVN
jgi:CheY-like chemotaxis protein/two-component sensor histidine kinase